MNPSGEQWTITSGAHEAVVVEVGGGLRAYRLAGVEIVDEYPVSELCPASAGQVLAPWPNRIRDGRYVFADRPQQLALTEPAKHNAIHGLVNWSRWRLVERSDDALTLEFDMPAQPGYPWPLHLRSMWTVGPAGLSATHTVTNLADESCPFGFSVHPYLTMPGVPVDDLVLHVPGRNRLLVDGRLLPIGAARVAGGEFDFTEPRRIGGLVLDTAFGDVIRDGDGGSAVTVSTGDGASRIRIWADSGFGWWQVFSSDTLPPDRFRRSLAVEPMTCPPDAFRSGRDLIVLAPGETWTGGWGIEPGGIETRGADGAA